MSFRGFIPTAKIKASVKRGSTWQQLFILKNKTNGEQLDLTGLKARATVRLKTSDTGTPILELTSANGRLTVCPTVDEVEYLGGVLISVNSTDCALLSPANVTRVVGFDIDLYDDTVAPYYIITPVEVELNVLAEFTDA